MDKKYYKKPDNLKPDKFPIYLTNGSVAGLTIWLILTVIWVSSTFVFGIGLQDYLEGMKLLLIFLCKVVLVPVGILLIIVALALGGFTLSSYLAKRRRNKMLKASIQKGKA